VKEAELGIVIATVVEAEAVKGTNRLHRIRLDIGGGKLIQIASGVPGDFAPGFLIGRQVPVQVNVEPIEVRGIRSEARFLTTSGPQQETVLLSPVTPVPAGSKVW